MSEGNPGKNGLEKEPYLVLGLDAGKTSLGWCLLDTANQRVVALNSRLFPAPEVGKDEQSAAAVRSAARRGRKLTKRRRAIRSHCLALIDGAGLCELPHDAGGSLDLEACGKLLQRKAGEGGVLELRVDALARPLSGRELARLLYGMSSHRGYIPHGEAASEDKEEGKVLSALAANDEAMRAAGYETLAQLQAANLERDGHYRNKGKDYSMCVSNAQYVAEIDAIFAKQAALGNPFATDELKNRYLKECFQYLTDTTAQEARIYSRVAPCVYFAPEKAAARCCPSFEMARAWGRLTNVRVLHEQGGSDTLSRSTIEAAIAMLFSPEPLAAGKSPKKLTWKALRKLEGLSGRDSFKGISEEREKSAAVEAPAWAAFRRALPAGLLSRMLDDRELGDAAGSALAYCSRADSLRKLLDGEASTDMPWAVYAALAGLDDAEADALAAMDCTGKLYSGYGTRSARALRMIVEGFEQGEGDLSDIEQARGLSDKRNAGGEPMPFLGMYEQFEPTCNNPVVLRAMSNVRKVVNAVIREYGRPAEIHVELARELKLSKKVQSEIDRKNKRRRDERDDRRAEVAKWMGVEPENVPNRLLLKVQLLEEQGWLDAYTGAPIRKEDFVANPRMVEVDHILPRSRSLDDSQSNKVCVLAKSNQDKKQRTPYEWMNSGEPAAPDWAAFCARVGASKLDGKKKAKLLETAFAENEKKFIDRNLNDTRYMTTKTAQWLSNTLQFAPLPAGKTDHIRTPSGGTTSLLRHCWGFDAKDRSANELHHAVDAAIIAACDQAIVQKVARVHSSKHYVTRDEYKALLADAEPWPGFAAEVQAMAAVAIPSRMADRSRTGRLFEDTLYRLEGYNAKGHGVLSCGKGESKKSAAQGNYVQLSDGSCVLPAGMAFLQLWWDPEGKVRGKKTPGCWLADPVYYSGMKAFEDGTYVPRFGKQGVPRVKWEPVPERAMKRKPLRLCSGDMILVKGQPRLFVGFGIATYQWKLGFPDKPWTDQKQREEAKKGLSFASCHFDEIALLDVGPLGLPFGPKN